MDPKRPQVIGVAVVGLFLIAGLFGYLMSGSDAGEIEGSVGGNGQFSEDPDLDELEELEEMPYDVDFGRGEERLEYENFTIDVNDAPFMGSEDADSVIVSYEDFFCPFCVGFHNPEYAQEEGMSSAFPQIIENHVETGEAQFYMKNYPTSGGIVPASYAECVSEEGSSEDYYKFSFNHFSKWDGIEKLIQNENTDDYEGVMNSWIEQLEADLDDVQACLESGESEENLNSTFEEVDNMNKDFGTPAVFIDGELVEGAHPYSVFEDLFTE